MIGFPRVVLSPFALRQRMTINAGHKIFHCSSYISKKTVLYFHIFFYLIIYFSALIFLYVLPNVHIYIWLPVSFRCNLRYQIPPLKPFMIQDLTICRNDFSLLLISSQLITSSMVNSMLPYSGIVPFRDHTEGHLLNHFPLCNSSPAKRPNCFQYSKSPLRS